MSEFIDRCNHFYLQTDGTYNFPNSAEGDLLKIGLKEIRELLKANPYTVCETCGGSGEVDDAEPGDISYNTYKCPDCGGSGHK